MIVQKHPHRRDRIPADELPIDPTVLPQATRPTLQKLHRTHRLAAITVGDQPVASSHTNEFEVLRAAPGGAMSTGRTATVGTDADTTADPTRLHTGRNDIPTALVSIALARPDEAETLTMLIRASAAYDGGYRLMVANQTVDTAYIENNVVRVAHGPDGEVWGFYSLLIPGRGTSDEAELDFMFVANEMQGRGIGRALLGDLRVTVSRLRLSRVHIVAHPPSEPFYLACGARRIGQVPPAGRVTWVRPHLTLELSHDAQA